MHAWLDLAVQAVIAGIAVLALLVSLAALVPGFVGISRADKANEIATNSNAMAAGANALSAKANGIASNAHQLALAQEKRSTEPYDVEWTLGWIDETRLFLANQGLDAAHNVRFRIGGIGSFGVGPAEPVIPPWGRVTPLSDAVMTESAMRQATVLLRVVWTSPAGAPHRVSLTISGKQVFEHRLGVG